MFSKAFHLKFVKSRSYLVKGFVLTRYCKQELSEFACGIYQHSILRSTTTGVSSAISTFEILNAFCSPRYSRGLIDFRHGWSASVMVKGWTINPEVRGSISGLVGKFLRHLVFPTQLQLNWFETQR